MDPISETNLELIRDQCVNTLVDQTALTDAEIKEVIFGQSPNYVAYVKELRALIEWAETYTTRNNAYEEVHQAFTTGGK